MGNIGPEGLQFIDLSWISAAFLFVVGFIGGLVSGFIGSGGAFVLTPGMMSLGVPGTVAVASNMCHKFPKAMVGAYKRWRYGQVDLKLGVVMAASATVGVQIGIKIQELILGRVGTGRLESVCESWPSSWCSSRLVGTSSMMRGRSHGRETRTILPHRPLARWLQSIQSPADDPFQDREHHHFTVVHYPRGSGDGNAGCDHRSGRVSSAFRE
jgi:hypothetical protein